MKQEIYLNRNGANTDIEKNVRIERYIADNSIIDRPNVRNALLKIEESIKNTMGEYIGSYNDNITREELMKNLEVLKELHPEVTNWRVICDETNNTSKTINNGLLVAEIFVQPVKSVETIHISSVIGANV